MNKQSTEGFQEDGDTLYGITVMDYVLTCLSKPTEYIISRGNPNVNYRLCVIVMCQQWFTLGTRCTVLVNDVGGGHASVREESVWEIAAPFSLHSVVNLKLF